jgi:hypothetical protein
MEHHHGMEHEHGGSGHEHPGPPPPPTFGSHGMLLIGEDAVFLSHLPMFMFNSAAHPHNFQVILAVTFEEREKAAYVQDRREHPEMPIYTFVPDDFEMDHLDPKNRMIESLRGTVHRGHFERHHEDGGVAIATAEVSITDVILFRPFKQGERQPDQLEYLLFGRGASLFLAHLITSAPDFDQSAAVHLEDERFNDAQLAQGVRVSVAGRPNRAPDRLKANERVQVQIRETATSGTRDVGLVVDDELYFEEGELGSPFNPEQTPEEERAGF